MYGPLEDSKKIGVPPTPLKALTGELTPPGITFNALCIKDFDLTRFIYFLKFGNALESRFYDGH